MADEKAVGLRVSRRQFLGASAAASVAAFSSCGSVCAGKDQQPQVAASQGESAGETLGDLYREVAQVLFQARPLCATDNGLSEDDVGQYYAKQLGDFSPEAEQRLRQRLRQLSWRIRDCPLTSASQGEQETREVMCYLTRFLGGHPDFSVGLIDIFYGLVPYPVNQFTGPALDVVYTLQSAHQIRDEKDALDYIDRLGRFSNMCSSLQEKVQGDLAQNWIPPKVVLERTIHTFDNIQKPDPVQHSLVKTLAKKLQALDGISQSRRETLTEAATKNVAKAVCPAYRALLEQAKGLLATARSEGGIWAQPNGEEFYQDAIQQLGDSDLNPDEIHRLGLNEVERIVDEMDALLRANNYQEGTVAERITALSTNPQFLYPDTEDGRKQLIEDLNQRLEEVTAKMVNVSKTVPLQGVEVRPMPVDLQDSGPKGIYWQPSVDGTKPGIFMINLRDMKVNAKFSLPTLLYHETIPGHHWQVSLAMGLRDLPLLRQLTGSNAYAEGWALYAEHLAEELGLYEHDPFGNLGRLQEELFRAARLVVDTGLHHKRWTREKAIRCMSDITGVAESRVAVEIERYMAIPGQALGYKLGMLKILGLRDRAKRQLGRRFDLAEFHDVILLGGAVPLPLLERRVNQWVASRNRM